jgi:hypothetical protein
MELVARKPEKIVIMAKAMPPIKDKSYREISDEYLPENGESSFRNLVCNLKDRRFMKPMIPREATHNSNGELKEVNDDYSFPPTCHIGQCLVGNKTFKDHKENSKPIVAGRVSNEEKTSGPVITIHLKIFMIA